MIKVLRGLVVAVGLLTFATPLWAQSAVLSLAQTYTRAEQALSDGSPATTIDLANSILRQNPNDFQALFLLSLGYSETDQHDAAANAATQAYRAALNDEERLISARVAGAAYFATGQFTRAEWWLRRAANNVETDDEAQLVRQEFDAIRDANPLSARFGFSVAPSNNINGGSKEAFFTLGDIVFEFGPKSRALSGIEYSGYADLSYRLSRGENHITKAMVYLHGRTYSLSPSSQATVPDVSGSDYAYAVAELSLNHRQMLFDGLGPTGVSVSVGQIWQAGSPLWRYSEFSLSQNFSIGQNASALIRASIENRAALDSIQSDTTIYDLQGIYAVRLGNQDTLRLTLGYRFNDALDVSYTYSDISASVNYDLRRPILGTDLSFEIGGGYKNYDEFLLSLDGRRDTYVTVGTTAVLERISYFGFSPMVTISATRTFSNVARYSMLEVQGSFGIQSNF